MIRTVLINPLTVAITLAIGIAVCKLLGAPLHQHQMMQATIIALVAGELAIVPLILTRRANQMVISQAALGAMVLHLLIITGAVALMPFDRPFVIWLAAFYGATLISMSAISIAALRSAPLAPSTAKPQNCVDGSTQ